MLKTHEPISRYYCANLHAELYPCRSCNGTGRSPGGKWKCLQCDGRGWLKYFWRTK